MVNTMRYSDQELSFFKNHIEQKILKAQEEYNFMNDQIAEISELLDRKADYIDDSSNSNELTMLYTMTNRLVRHIRDLNNALIRIRNKTYGICSESGILIDRKRLMAVPTTTKSLAAKHEISQKAKQPIRRPKPNIFSKNENGRNKTIPKVNRKLKSIENVESFDDDTSDFFPDDLTLDLELDELSDEIN